MLSTKVTIKDQDLKQKKTNGYPMGSTRQVCHVLPREIFFYAETLLIMLEDSVLLNLPYWGQLNIDLYFLRPRQLKSVSEGKRILFDAFLPIVQTKATENEQSLHWHLQETNLLWNNYCNNFQNTFNIICMEYIT